MTIDKLISKLHDMRIICGGNVPIVFDTEASEFNCHLIDVSSAEFVKGSFTDGIDRVVLHFDRTKGEIA